MTLANPVLVTVNRTYVVYTNAVPNRVVMTKVMRYPASGSPYAQERALIRMNFVDIPPSDIASYEEAFRLASEAYVFLSLTGLGLTLQLDAGHAILDTAFVTVAPGTSFAPDVQAGSTRSEATGLMDGPYLFTFSLSFITGDLFFTNGN